MPVAFLVDGQTEQRFIQEICPNSVVQRLNLNGTGVSAEAIAKRASSLIRLWGGKYYPIVVLVDLEGRSVSHDAFSEDLYSAIATQGIKDEVRVCVAKRMIENWVLADSELIGWTDPVDNVDDYHGAFFLKKILGDYDKAGDGPTLLRRARASRIRIRSPSFDFSFRKLMDLKCPWLMR